MAEIGNHKILQFCSFSPLGTDSSFQENGLKKPKTKLPFKKYQLIPFFGDSLWSSFLLQD